MAFESSNPGLKSVRSTIAFRSAFALTQSFVSLALILYRVMRMSLKDAGAKTSPERALEVPRRIQHHQVRLKEKTSMQGISSITQEQTDLFKALNVKKPASTHA